MRPPPLLVRTFRVPGFSRLWLGSMYWYSARWMELFTLQWLVLLLTDSAFHVTLVGFYRMAPLFLFGLVTGLIADRVDRRRVLLFAQLWNAAMTASLALLIVTGRLALWHLAVLVTALGLSWALDLPSRRSYLYDMIGPGTVQSAMALDQLGMDGARAIGPLFAGLLWPLIGPAGCLLILAAGYVLNFVVYRGLPPAQAVRVSARGPILRNLADGLRYALRSPIILGVLSVTVVMNLLGFPYQQVTPVLAKKVLALGPSLAGVLLAGDGLGAITTSLFLASRERMPPKWRLFVFGSACLMVSVFAFSFSRFYPLSFLLLFLAGCGIACFSSCQSSLILLSASDEMRGRAVGTLLLAIGFQPLGALLIGAIASALGAPVAIALTSGVGIALLALLLRQAKGLWTTKA